MTEIALLVRRARLTAQITVHGAEITVRLGGREVRVRLERLDGTVWRAIMDDGPARLVRTIDEAGTRWIHVDGETLAVRIDAVRPRPPAATRPEWLEAPMPGAVTQVAVGEGDLVAAGQPIVIVEAMKMEHVIRAPHAGRVLALRVRAGDQIEAGAVVAELTPEEPGR